MQKIRTGANYQTRLGVPFAHDAHLAQLAALRDQLKAGLTGGQPEPGALSPPTVTELADQIKALRAAHAIEATHERLVRRRAAAEEPVTARIRQRSGGNSEPPAETAALPAAVPATVSEASVQPAAGPHTARVLADRTGPTKPSPAAARLRQRALF